MDQHTCFSNKLRASAEIVICGPTEGPILIFYQLLTTQANPFCKHLFTQLLVKSFKLVFEEFGISPDEIKYNGYAPVTLIL